MKKYFGIFMVVVCLLCVTACGKGNKLVGKWTGETNDGLETTFNFKKDGKVEYSNEYGFDSTGTYEIKKDVVTITLESWSESKEYKFEVKDGKLSLTAQDKYSPSYKEMIKK